MERILTECQTLLKKVKAIEQEIDALTQLSWCKSLTNDKQILQLDLINQVKEYREKIDNLLLAA